MSRLLPELETVLRALADEHRRLLACVEAQHSAMKVFDLKAMDDARNQQEASRLRVAALETKRRTVVAHIAKGVKLDGKLTLSKIADLHPPRRDALLAGAVEKAGLYTKHGVPSVSSRIGMMEAVG